MNTNPDGRIRNIFGGGGSSGHSLRTSFLKFCTRIPFRDSFDKFLGLIDQLIFTPFIGTASKGHYRINLLNSVLLTTSY